MKKALSTLLALIMVLMMIPLSSVVVFADGEPVQVSSKEELLAMTTGSYVLTKDIDLGGETYAAAPIVLNGATVDGAGYSVTGFTLSAEGDISLMTLEGTVSIKNLNVGANGAPISVTTTGTSGTNIGVIAANTSATVTLENIDVYANITASADATGFHHVGGLLGTVSGATTVKNCSFTGRVMAGTNVAYATSNYRSNNPQNGGFTGAAAGMVGKADSDNADITVQNCVNNGTISGYDNVAGMIGYTKTSSFEISNCVNNGAISAKYHFAGGMLGGLLRPSYSSGDRSTDTYDFDITGCINNADITGTNKGIGGILGIACANVNNTSERKDNKEYALNISACVNYGEVKAVNNATYADCAGGLVGIIRFGSSVLISNCANYGAVKGATKVTGCIAESNVFDGGQTTIEGFLNVGDITASGKQAAGLVGYGNFKDISSKYDTCVNLGTITAGNGEAAGISAGETNAVTAKNCISVGKVNASTTVYPTANKADTSTSSGCAWYNTMITDTTVKDVMGNAPLADLNAALAILNTSTYTDVWGGFKIDGDKIVVLTPKYVGYQTSEVENNNYNLRFGAVMDEYTLYEAAGFDMVYVSGSDVAKVGKSHDAKCNTVYTSILEKNKPVAASIYGGKYFFCFTINGLTVGQTYTFTVKPYVSVDGSAKIYGETVTVSFTVDANGNIVD